MVAGKDNSRMTCVQVYYHNTATNESSWTKPEGFSGDTEKAAAPPVPVSQQRVPGTDWSRVSCRDGKAYFYNNGTKVCPVACPAQTNNVLPLPELVPSG